MSAVILTSCLILGLSQDAPTQQEVVRALNAGKLAEAETLATKLIAANDKKGVPYALRGDIRASADKLLGAIEDFTAALTRELGTKERAAVLDRRGNCHFMNAQIKESIDDFDAFLKLDPDAMPKHWRRGISYYYAGRYDEGRNQFEAYENVDGNDVENVVWRAMCVARKDGVEKSRANMAKVGFDQRVPMMTVYKLFKGEATPADVLKDAQTQPGPRQEPKSREFYAHLYLGFYSEIVGDKAATKEHLEKALAVYPHGPYMWAVARTHLKLLEKAKE
jgi:lipoprotein NlpI